MTATARKLAVIYYNMLKYKTPYKDLGKNFYAQYYKKRSIRRLGSYAKSLGYSIIKNDQSIENLQ